VKTTPCFPLSLSKNSASSYRFPKNWLMTQAPNPEKDSEIKIPDRDSQIAMCSFIQDQVSKSPGSCPFSYFLQVSPGVFKFCFMALGNSIHSSNLLKEILSA